MTPERKSQIRIGFLSTSAAYKQSVAGKILESNIDAEALNKAKSVVKLTNFFGQVVDEMRRDKSALQARINQQIALESEADALTQSVFKLGL